MTVAALACHNDVEPYTYQRILDCRGVKHIALMHIIYVTTSPSVRPSVDRVRS